MHQRVQSTFLVIALCILSESEGMSQREIYSSENCRSQIACYQPRCYLTADCIRDKDRIQAFGLQIEPYTVNAAQLNLIKNIVSEAIEDTMDESSFSNKTSEVPTLTQIQELDPTSESNPTSVPTQHSTGSPFLEIFKTPIWKATLSPTSRPTHAPSSEPMSYSTFKTTSGLAVEPTLTKPARSEIIITESITDTMLTPIIQAGRRNASEAALEIGSTSTSLSMSTISLKRTTNSVSTVIQMRNFSTSKESVSAATTQEPIRLPTSDVTTETAKKFRRFSHVKVYFIQDCPNANLKSMRLCLIAFYQALKVIRRADIPFGHLRQSIQRAIDGNENLADVRVTFELQDVQNKKDLVLRIIIALIKIIDVFLLVFGAVLVKKVYCHKETLQYQDTDGTESEAHEMVSARRSMYNASDDESSVEELHLFEID